MEFLFVYGSLRPKISRNMIDLYHGMYRAVGPAAVTGDLYNLGAYPCLKMEGKGSVSGIILELIHPDMLSRLDEYEGYAPEDEQNSLFIRKQLQIQQAENEKVCWVYEFNGEVTKKWRVPSGDWKKHLSAR